MMEFIYLVAGIIIGLLFGLRKQPPKEDHAEILVKRNRPNFSNPMRTTKTSYDRYKTRDNGLYAPVKPKGETKDSIEVGR